PSHPDCRQRFLSGWREVGAVASLTQVQTKGDVAWRQSSFFCNSKAIGESNSSKSMTTPRWARSWQPRDEQACLKTAAVMPLFLCMTATLPLIQALVLGVLGFAINIAFTCIAAEKSK